MTPAFNLHAFFAFDMYVLLLLSLLYFTVAIEHPSQVRLSLSGSTIQDDMIEIVVSFVFDTNISYVEWGLSSTSLPHVKRGQGSVFTMPRSKRQQIIHDIRFVVPQDKEIFYRCGTDDLTLLTGENKGLWTHVMSFVMPSSNHTSVIFGDFGDVNDVVMERMISEAVERLFDLVLHVGDIAYDLQDSTSATSNTNTYDGSVGDRFLEDFQPVTSKIPYHVMPGNHETWEHFAHYDHRFSSMLITAQNSGSSSPRYYSFNRGLIHFIALNTESYTDHAYLANQISWLRSDLIVANKNRRNVPWIVLCAHKSYWMKTNWTEFENLSHEFRVDMAIVGHQHNYERMWPTFRNISETPHKALAPCNCNVNGSKTKPSYCDGSSISNNTYINPKYLTTIVVGSPGCKEDLSGSWGPKSASAVKIKGYGYGHLHAINKTHLLFDWELVDNDRGIKVDSLLLIQENPISSTSNKIN